MSKFNLRSFLIGKLRRLSYQYPVRKEVKARARYARGLYRCELCNTSLRNGEYALDHKAPVVDLKRGFQDWNIYIDRLFCDASGLQLICQTCHDLKTKKEQIIRRKYARKEIRQRKTQVKLGK